MLVQEENQSLENALRTLLQELVVSFFITYLAMLIFVLS